MWRNTISNGFSTCFQDHIKAKRSFKPNLYKDNGAKYLLVFLLSWVSWIRISNNCNWELLKKISIVCYPGENILRTTVTKNFSRSSIFKTGHQDHEKAKKSLSEKFCVRNCGENCINNPEFLLFRSRNVKNLLSGSYKSKEVVRAKRQAQRIAQKIFLVFLLSWTRNFKNYN